ncbi:MAG: hypothetical protein AAGC88_17150, partial [Bacteroidota bacterium]
MNTPINKALLEKYYDGQCSDEEKEQVEAWLDSDRHDAPLELEEISRHQLKSRMWQQIEEGTTIEKVKTIPLYRKALPYAAAITLLFMVAFSAYFFLISPENTNQFAQVNYETFVTQRGQKRTLTLSDGSTIRLNYESEFKAPRHFDEDLRVVYLAGHAH